MERNKVREAEGRAKKRDYEDSKMKALQFEEQNYGYILLVETTDGWYKMFANSTILYRYYVLPLAKEKLDNPALYEPKIKADLDFRYKAKIGVLYFKNREQFEVPLKAVGAEKVKIAELKSERILAYKLTRKMTMQEFVRLKEDEDALWNKSNTLITPKAVFPDLGIDIQEMGKLFYDNVRKFDKTTREVLGGDVLRSTRRLAKGLIMAEKDYTSWEIFFRTGMGIIGELYADVSLLSDMRLVENNTLLRMTESIGRVENDIKKAMKEWQKQQKR